MNKEILRNMLHEADETITYESYKGYVNKCMEMYQEEISNQD